MPPCRPPVQVPRPLDGGAGQALENQSTAGRGAHMFARATRRKRRRRHPAPQRDRPQLAPVLARPGHRAECRRLHLSPLAVHRRARGAWRPGTVIAARFRNRARKDWHQAARARSTRHRPAKEATYSPPCPPETGRNSGSWHPRCGSSGRTRRFQPAGQLDQVQGHGRRRHAGQLAAPISPPQQLDAAHLIGSVPDWRRSAQAPRGAGAADSAGQRSTRRSTTAAGATPASSRRQPARPGARHGPAECRPGRKYSPLSVSRCCKRPYTRGLRHLQP